MPKLAAASAVARASRDPLSAYALESDGARQAPASSIR